MGHNRSGVKRKLKIRRRRKEEKRLAERDEPAKEKGKAEKS